MKEISKRYTDDFKRIVVEVYETGKPIKEIFEEYDITYTSVNKINPKQKISSKPVIKLTKQHKETSKEDKDKILRLKKKMNELYWKTKYYTKGVL